MTTGTLLRRALVSAVPEALEATAFAQVNVSTAALLRRIVLSMLLKINFAQLRRLRRCACS